MLLLALMSFSFLLIADLHTLCRIDGESRLDCKHPIPKNLIELSSFALEQLKCPTLQADYLDLQLPMPSLPVMQLSLQG